MLPLGLDLEIPLRPPSSQDLTFLFRFNSNDSDFISRMKKNIANSSLILEKDVYWPTTLRRTRLLNKFNLKYKTRKDTQYTVSGIEDQITPGLMMNFAIRKMFKIKGGEGRIFNADESLAYRWIQSTKTWGV